MDHHIYMINSGHLGASDFILQQKVNHVGHLLIADTGTLKTAFNTSIDDKSVSVTTILSPTLAGLQLSAANLALAGFPPTNALGECMPSRLQNMFNLCLCNAATIRYSQLKFGYMHLCGMDYKYFSPHCCKCNSFGCTAAIRCGDACHGPHSDNLYSGSEHSQFNSPRLVKREAGFPNPRRALIGSNQLWCVNHSPYYREYPQ